MLICFSIQKNLSIIVIQVRNRLLNREKMIFAISNKTLQIIWLIHSSMRPIIVFMYIYTALMKFFYHIYVIKEETQARTL